MPKKQIRGPLRDPLHPQKIFPEDRRIKEQALGRIIKRERKREREAKIIAFFDKLAEIGRINERERRELINYMLKGKKEEFLIILNYMKKVGRIKAQEYNSILRAIS